MDLIDLHTHSTASDGSDSPAALVGKAAKIGLKAIALTDHDTTAGLDEAEAEAEACGIEFIRGCEISTRAEYGEIHVLGLWLPRSCPELDAFLKHLRAARYVRNDQIIEKLQSQGIKITKEDAAAFAGGSLGRPHIARAMLQKGYVESLRQAFDIWLGKGGKAYVPKPVPPPADAVRLLASVGACPVIAHPLLRPMPQGWLTRFAASLLPMGLFGLEAWHSAQTPGQTQEILQVAQNFNLGVSGGSDYHGLNKKEISLGFGRNNLSVGVTVLENLKKRRAANISRFQANCA